MSRPEISGPRALAVGTDSALQLQVQESSGLTQVDAAVFPRIPTQDLARPIPQSKAFFYTYPALGTGWLFWWTPSCPPTKWQDADRHRQGG